MEVLVLENLYFAGSGDDFDDITCVLSEIRTQMEALELLGDAWSRSGFGGGGYCMVCAVQDYVTILTERASSLLEKCLLK